MNSTRPIIDPELTREILTALETDRVPTSEYAEKDVRRHLLYLFEKGLITSRVRDIRRSPERFILRGSEDELVRCFTSESEPAWLRATSTGQDFLNELLNDSDRDGQQDLSSVIHVYFGDHFQIRQISGSGSTAIGRNSSATIESTDKGS